MTDLHESTAVSVEEGVGPSDGAVGGQGPRGGGASVVADITRPAARDG